MYLVGIDISKYKYDCFIATEAGEIIKDAFTFQNNSIGFQVLREALSCLDKPGEIKIGLEATGHYGKNLKLFLNNNGYSFMEFNPYLVKRFATSLTLRKTKTDSADAKLLSLILNSVTYQTYPLQSYHMNDLKSLSRYHKKLIHKHSRELVSLTIILDQIFPEFKPFFGNKFTQTAVFILTNYKTPERIMNINSKSFEKIRKISQYSFNTVKFVKLKTLAKNTVGYTSKSLELKLDMILDSANHLSDQINVLESYLTKQIKLINPPTLSIRGIGPLSALSIITEYGDINNFSSPKQMLSYAGLDPSVIQSGMIDKTGKLVKRDSSFLRETLMNSASTFAIHNPVIYEYYMKKKAEGKAHRVVLTHIAKKLIRIIHHLEKNNIAFDSSKLR